MFRVLGSQQQHLLRDVSGEDLARVGNDGVAAAHWNQRRSLLWPISLQLEATDRCKISALPASAVCSCERSWDTDTDRDCGLRWAKNSLDRGSGDHVRLPRHSRRPRSPL